MILAIHIFLALLSIVYGVFVSFSPTAKRLRFAYASAACTLVSGVGLVIIKPQTLAHTCVSGLIFFAIIGFLLHRSQKKLATVKID